MLDLDMVFGMREQVLPTQGFWGLVLENWLTIAIVVMVLGFAVDQILYVVRYRPQDKWKRRYYDFRNFLTEKYGIKPVEEKWKEVPNPLQDTGVTVEKASDTDVVFERPEPDSHPDAPVIRRGGAQFTPRPIVQSFETDDRDEDAPNIVRARATPAPDERCNAEPNTQHQTN